MPRYIDIEDVAGRCYLLLAWPTGERFAIRADTITEPMAVQGGEDPDDIRNVVW